MVPGCHIRAVLDKEPCEIEVTAEGRQMKGSRPALVLGSHVDALLDEELRDIEMTV